jgi:hypothetical protein
MLLDNSSNTNACNLHYQACPANLLPHSHPTTSIYLDHLELEDRSGQDMDHWYVSNVSIIFYAPCLFIHHFFVFCYTSWRFYAFSGTNLLTRCHSASSLFSAVFVFQKSYTRNILRIGGNKSRTSYFYWSFAKIEDETEGGWYVSNVSLIFDDPCLFMHHLPCVLLHFVAFLCDFWN